MTSARRLRRRTRRAMLRPRRRRFTIHWTGRFETAAEIRIIHEIPRTS